MLGIEIPAGVWYALGAVALAGASFAAGYYYAGEREDSKDLELIEGLEGGEGFEMASHAGASRPGILSSYLRERKKRSALGKGVVRWHLVGASFESPKYIKPKRKEGGNVPEVEYEGETYVFPEKAAVPSEEEGVPVVVHRVGEAEPISLRDSWEDAIDAGTLAQYLTLRVTSTKPTTGLLDGLGLAGGWDAMTVFRYGLLAIIGFAVLAETLGGGLY